MSDVDRFFNDEITNIQLESSQAVRQAARELERDIQSQIKNNFSQPSAAFMAGVKVYDFDYASYVRLSPLLSSFAQEASPQKIKGNPNLWILLPSGAKLGFKRLSSSFSYPDLKRRYGSRLSFIPVSNGHAVLYRQPNGIVTPIYKLQKAVNQTQKIDLYGAAQKYV